MIDSWVAKDHAPRHHPKILLHADVAIEISALASATFR